MRRPMLTLEARQHARERREKLAALKAAHHKLNEALAAFSPLFRADEQDRPHRHFGRLEDLLEAKISETLRTEAP